MKKRILRILAATLALAAMLSLAACGGNGGSSRRRKANIKCAEREIQRINPERRNKD